MENAKMHTTYTWRDEPYADGRLRICETHFGGVRTAEYFTFASLVNALSLTQSQAASRYARGRLAAIKVNVPTGQSRPVRGFPLVRLADVVAVLTERGARLTDSAPPERQRNPPVGNLTATAEYHHGKPYLTIAGMADYFGVSITSVRNKLIANGLMNYAVNLYPIGGGGRPKRGWALEHAELLESVIGSSMGYSQFLARSAQALAHSSATSVGASVSRPQLTVVNPTPGETLAPHDPPAPAALASQPEAPEDIFADIQEIMDQMRKVDEERAARGIPSVVEQAKMREREQVVTAETPRPRWSDARIEEHVAELIGPREIFGDSFPLAFTQLAMAAALPEDEVDEFVRQCMARREAALPAATETKRAAYAAYVAAVNALDDAYEDAIEPPPHVQQMVDTAVAAGIPWDECVKLLGARRKELIAEAKRDRRNAKRKAVS